MCGSKMPANQSPQRAWYMWTDTWFDAAAKKNPLRWGKPLSLSALVRELSAQPQSRPLRIFLDMPDGRIERRFAKTETAVLWLRGRFNCDIVPTESVARRQFSLVNSCMTPRLAPSAEEHEEIVHSFESCISTSEALLSRNSTGNSGTRSRNAASATLSDTDFRATGTEAAIERRDQSSSISNLAGDKDVTHLEDEQVSHATLQYMWADAGTLLTRGLAQANPLRWSAFMRPQEVVKELGAALSRDRPVKLRTDAPGHHEVKTFDSVDAAVDWIRELFKIEQQDHLCVVCLEAQVTTMLMPCRHAVLCDDCAGSILAQSGSCPVCREHITNHARGHFAEDYVDLVQAMEARMARSQAAACEGMYNNIRPLMVTGALLGTGAAACFVLASPAAPVLGAAAFGVGYLPWFATTVAHFEREDMTDSTNLNPTTFFSREDLSRPLTLIAKTLTMAVVAPLAAVVFFIPYGFYAGIARPLAKALFHGLVRICAFAHVYALRPTAQGLQILTRGVLQLLTDIGYGTLDAAVILGNLLASGARRGGDILVTIAQGLHEHVLLPIGEGVRHGANLTYEHVLSPVGCACHRGASNAIDGVVFAAEATYNHVLLPSGQALRRTLEGIGNTCVAGGTNFYSYILLPSGRGIVFALRRTGEGLASGARAVYTYVLLPVKDCIASGANFTYSNALVPLGQGTLKALSMLAGGISVSAEFLYSNALVPLGHGTLKVLSMLARGIAVSAELLYANALVPLGQGTLRVLSMLARGISASAKFGYNYVLVPGAKASLALAHLSWVSLQALGFSLVSAATFVYNYILLPCAGGIAFVARGLGHGLCSAARATHEHVLVPSAQAIALCGSTIYVHVLRPSGHGLYRAGTATVESVQAGFAAAAQHITNGAQVVYVYVLQPSGQAVVVAAIASRDAVASCAREVQNVVCTAANSVREAGRESIQALQSAARGSTR